MPPVGFSTRRLRLAKGLLQFEHGNTLEGLVEDYLRVVQLDDQAIGENPELLAAHFCSAPAIVLLAELGLKTENRIQPRHISAIRFAPVCLHLGRHRSPRRLLLGGGNRRSAD